MDDVVFGSVALAVVALDFAKVHMTHSQMLGKVESGGGPIFKVFLECLKRCSEPFLIDIYGIQCDFMPKSC